MGHKLQISIAGNEKLAGHFNFTPIDVPLNDEQAAKFEEAIATLDILDAKRGDDAAELDATLTVPKIPIGFIHIGGEQIPVEITMKVANSDQS